MGNKSFAIRPFEKLKKKIESKHAVSTPSAPARHKKKNQFTEEELFSTAMGDVQEIEAFREMPVVPRPQRVIPERGRFDPDREALTILGEIAGGQRPIDLPDTQEYVEWMNPEFRGEIIQNLHAGRFSVQSFLDLHGCTVLEAETEVEAFLKDSFRKGLRCVKIIHGRGLRSPLGPTLKTAVIKRLSGRYRKSIIAYVTARQCDGGLGALYVLLRKK